MAATTTSCQVLWLRNLLSKVIRSELTLVTFDVDDKSTIALMKNLIFYEHSKHVDTRFHFIRECVEKRQIVVEFVCTREQHADILTSVLRRDKSLWSLYALESNMRIF